MIVLKHILQNCKNHNVFTQALAGFKVPGEFKEVRCVQCAHLLHPLLTFFPFPFLSFHFLSTGSKVRPSPISEVPTKRQMLLHLFTPDWARWS
jgi:hypothetical protein